MKTRLTALCLALLFCSCTARAETPAEPQTPTPPPVTEAPQKTEPQSLSPPPAAADLMTIENGKANITLCGIHSFDGLCLQGIEGDGSLQISINDNKIYDQENESSTRWCWFGQQNSDSTRIELPDGCNIDSQFKLSEPAKGLETRLSAYLPHSSYSEQILVSEALESLDELTINTGCYWLADASLEVKQNLPNIIDTIQNAYPELDIFCTINPKKGGAAAIMNAEIRQKLVQSMVDFCTEQNLAGVDIDWEFPAEDQWDEFSDLIVELSSALSSSGKRLSLAFYPEDVNLSPEAIKAIHKVNVMAYDQFDEQGRHSTYETALDSIDYFLSLGFEAEQLSLGIPAYGRPLSGEAVWPLYTDYADQLIGGINLLNDNYFNSPQLAQDKTLLARQEGLQGVFLYHLGCDSYNENSLTLACAEVLQ